MDVVDGLHRAGGGGPLDLGAQRIVGGRVILEHFLTVHQEHRRRILGNRRVLRAFLGARARRLAAARPPWSA
jgi:hypothetical protein